MKRKFLPPASLRVRNQIGEEGHSRLRTTAQGFSVNGRKSNGTHESLDLNEICVEEGIGEPSTIQQIQREIN
jgi:hypothetical protein